MKRISTADSADLCHSNKYDSTDWSFLGKEIIGKEQVDFIRKYTHNIFIGKSIRKKRRYKNKK